MARSYGVTATTLYCWKSAYGDMDVFEAKRLRELEAEKGKLKRTLADVMLDKAPPRSFSQRGLRRPRYDTTGPGICRISIR